MTPTRAATLVAAIWVAAVVAQTATPLSSTWALLDAVRHGAAAAFCTIWMRPRWGWLPVAAGSLSAVLLDVDHAVAGGSLDLSTMLSLGVRPPTHSLFAAIVLGMLAWPVLGRGTGIAVGMGVAIHVLEDSLDWPGVPLLYPVWAERHAIVPLAWVLVATLAFSLTSVWLGRTRRHR